METAEFLKKKRQTIFSLIDRRFVKFFSDPKAECEGKTTGYLGSWDYPEIMENFRVEVVREYIAVHKQEGRSEVKPVWAEMREKYFNGRSYVYPDEMIKHLNSFDSREIIGFLHYCTVYKERFHSGAYGVYAKEGYIGKLLLKLKEIKDSNNQL